MTMRIDAKQFNCGFVGKSSRRRPGHQHFCKKENAMASTWVGSRWAREIWIVASKEGPILLCDQIARGYRFLKLVAEAVQPRIVERNLGRAGTRKVDTGLPDVGAAKFFADCQAGIFFPVASTIVGVVMLYVGLRGILVILREIFSAGPIEPILGVLFVLIVAGVLCVFGVVGVLWAGHVLLMAARKSQSHLNEQDCALLKELLKKNDDIALGEFAETCETYGALAETIIRLRHLISEKDPGRAI
ncbi:hypothetical protein [Duganella vulcania]|uniref:Uncharacterized protein n=1 Tax=Duganella vulcania TaxID=2692166 RepID=A0A845GD87_9BURK|nr:hypothetical protein [Duganella vulcania]MYM92583.1 hypothetical protein [Duganella vulcania]